MLNYIAAPPPQSLLAGCNVALLLFGPSAPRCRAFSGESGGGSGARGGHVRGAAEALYRELRARAAGGSDGDAMSFSVTASFVELYDEVIQDLFLGARGL